MQNLYPLNVQIWEYVEQSNENELNDEDPIQILVKFDELAGQVETWTYLGIWIMSSLLNPQNYWSPYLRFFREDIKHEQLVEFHSVAILYPFVTNFQIHF